MQLISLPTSWYNYWRLVILPPYSVQAMAGRKRKRDRELAELHAVFDRLGVIEGSAAERVGHWYRRKVALAQANGHTDSCQCVTCAEGRVVERFLRELKL